MGVLSFGRSSSYQQRPLPTSIRRSRFATRLTRLTFYSLRALVVSHSSPPPRRLRAKTLALRFSWGTQPPPPIQFHQNEAILPPKRQPIRLPVSHPAAPSFFAAHCPPPTAHPHFNFQTKPFSHHLPVNPHSSITTPIFPNEAIFRATSHPQSTYIQPQTSNPPSSTLIAHPSPLATLPSPPPNPLSPPSSAPPGAAPPG